MGEDKRSIVSWGFVRIGGEAVCLSYDPPDRRFDLVERLLLLLDLFFDCLLDLFCLSLFPSLFVPAAWPFWFVFFDDEALGGAPRGLFGFVRSSFDATRLICVTS